MTLRASVLLHPRKGRVAQLAAFFKLVVTLSEKGIYKVSPDILINYVIGGVSVFVMCWIYFDFVGNGKPKDTKKWTLVNWWRKIEQCI